MFFFSKEKIKKRKEKSGSKSLIVSDRPIKCRSVGRHPYQIKRPPGLSFFRILNCRRWQQQFERKKLRKCDMIYVTLVRSSSETWKSGEPTIGEPTKRSRDTQWFVSHFTNTFISKKTNYHETKKQKSNDNRCLCVTIVSSFVNIVYKQLL